MQVNNTLFSKKWQWEFIRAGSFIRFSMVSEEIQYVFKYMIFVLSLISKNLDMGVTILGLLTVSSAV